MEDHVKEVLQNWASEDADESRLAITITGLSGGIQLYIHGNIEPQNLAHGLARVIYESTHGDPVMLPLMLLWIKTLTDRLAAGEVMPAGETAH